MQSLSPKPTKAQALRLIPIARVSTKDQADNGTSLDSQIAGDLEYIHRLGAEALPELREDVSGATPMLERKTGAIADAMMRSDKADGVVFYTADRFSRDLVDALITARAWLRAGYQIHFCDKGRLTDETDIVFLLSSWQGGQERKAIRERTQRGMRRKAEAGKWVGDAPEPYGARREGQRKDVRFVPHPAELAIVQRIFRMFNGTKDEVPMSLRAICETFDHESIPPPGQSGKAGRRATGKGWHPATVLRILKSEAYRGVVISKGQRISVPELAVIDEAAFEAARLQCELNRQTKIGARKHQYLLSDHLTCTCGMRYRGAIHTANGQDYFHYQCASVTRTKTLRTCAEKYVSLHALDNAVWGWLLLVMSAPETLVQAVREYLKRKQAERQNERDNVAALDKDIQRHASKLARLTAMCGDAEGSELEALRAESKRVGKALDALKNKRARAAHSDEGQGEIGLAQFAAELAKARARLQNVGFEGKRYILRRLDVRGQLRRDEQALRWLDVSCGVDANNLCLPLHGREGTHGAEQAERIVIAVVSITNTSR